MNFVNEKKIISTAPPLPPRKKSFSRKEKMPLPKKIVKLEKCDKHIANYIGKVGKMNSFSEKKESKIMKLFRMKRSCFKNEQPTSVYKFRPLPQIPQDENESKSKLSPNASFTEGGTLKPENYAEQLRIAAKLQQQTGLLKIGNTCVNPELSMLPEENYSILPNSILLNSHKSNLKNEYNLKSQSVENWGSIYADSFCSEPPPSINLKKCKSKLYSKYKSSRLCSTPKFPTPVLYCKQNSLVIANNFKQTITNQNVESTDNQCRTNGDYTETNKSIINNKYMDFVSNLKSNYKSDKISKSKSHVSISLDLEKTVVTKIAKYTSDLNLNYTKNVQSIYDKMIFRSLSKPPALPPETNRSSVKSFVSAFENLSNTNLNESTLDKPNITPLRNSSIKFKPVEKENSLKNRHLSLLESTIVHFKTDSDEKPRNSTADMISNLTTKKVKFYPEPKKTKEMIQSVESGINSVISSSSFDKSIVDDLKHLQLNDTHEHSFIIDPANTCPVNNKICFNHEIQFNLPQNIFQFIFENCQNYTFNFGELLTCLVNLDENPNHELLDKLSVFKEWNFIKNFREDLLKSAISIKKPEPSEINQNEIEKLEKLVESLREKQKEIVQKKETVKKSIKNQYFTIKTICEDNGERFTTYFQSISQNIKLMATLVNKICKLMYSCNSLLFTSQAFLFDNFETEILEKFDQLLLELTDSLQLKFDFDWNFTQYMEKFSSKLAPLEKKKIKQLIEINLIISIQENHYKNYTNWVQEIINMG
ncbi:hypothetical protein A3Q56_03686 [Intoshia linei]|uniref:Uncharacterized protein n=1 Tax=Intoshia linei TaxID=1819745 RepID=A0A177B2U1_9BILA|nr:hypothetical protein A3Q56_03686 [Intoshia linei]